MCVWGEREREIMYVYLYVRERVCVWVCTPTHVLYVLVLYTHHNLPRTSKHNATETQAYFCLCKQADKLWQLEEGHTQHIE